MARIRAIKPEAYSDPTLAKCSISARYLFTGLWTEADDEGRLYASPRRLLGSLFPHDEDISIRQVERWLQELIDLERLLP